MAEKSKINQELARLLGQADKMNEKILRKYEKDLIRLYEDSLIYIRGLIAGIYEKYGKEVDLATMQQYRRLTTLEMQIAGELRALKNESVKTINKSLADHYQENFYNTGYSTEKALQIKMGFGQLAPEQIQAAIVSLYEKINWQFKDGVTETVNQLFNQIRRDITQGLIQGDGYYQTAARIKGRFEKSVSNNMLRIVRTESQRARSAGTLAGYEKVEQAADKQGFETWREWVATLDNRTRPSHRAIDGQKANEDNLFTFPSGNTTPGPTLSGVAEEDIHCRCTTIIQVKGFEQQTRRTGKELIPYQTYEDWKDARL